MKKSNENIRQTDFAFGKKNYIFLAIAFLVVVIGFMLMAGGGSENPNDFSDAIFSVRRITIAPIVVLLGFGFGIYAIMYKPKN